MNYKGSKTNTIRNQRVSCTYILVHVWARICVRQSPAAQGHLQLFFVAVAFMLLAMRFGIFNLMSRA